MTLGQTGTTSVRGTVTDESGATNGVGAYEFNAIPPGTYQIAVESPGFRRFENTGLQLLVNVPATENVTLQVGSKLGDVEVSAQATTLNTTDLSLGIAFNENQVKELPMEGRNVPDY